MRFRHENSDAGGSRLCRRRLQGHNYVRSLISEVAGAGQAGQRKENFGGKEGGAAPGRNREFLCGAEPVGVGSARWEFDLGRIKCLGMLVGKSHEFP